MSFARITLVLTLMAAAQSALAQSQPGRVFAYRFDWDEEPRVLWADLGALIGAAHGLEIPFVFGHWELGRTGRVLFDESNRAGREALSAMMMSYWAEFAYSGDPGRGRDGTLPRWAPWQDGGETYAVLDTPDLLLPHPRLHLRAFALAPLSELDPLARIPGCGTAAAWCGPRIFGMPGSPDIGSARRAWNDRAAAGSPSREPIRFYTARHARAWS